MPSTGISLSCAMHLHRQVIHPAVSSNLEEMQTAPVDPSLSAQVQLKRSKIIQSSRWEK